MQQSFEDLQLLFPSQIDWETFENQKSDVPYSEEVISFLDDLSIALLHDKNCRSYPDVITFAFFCRRANIQKCKELATISELRQGRGVVFHVAPSNVPINFAFSLLAGLLGGNVNVVRVSTKEFPQVDLIASHLKKFLDAGRWIPILRRIALVRYDRGSAATSFFSSICNVRVIWGGDATISQIRKSPIPARSFDVTFADRYSMAALNASAMKEQDIPALASSFYNDTYLFDQNACSAPHLVVWFGDKERIEAMQTLFWKSLHCIVKEKYEFQPVMAVDKLTAFYRQSTAMSLRKNPMDDNLLVRVQLDQLPKSLENYKCAGGYFSEYIADDWSEVAEIVNNKYQTLAYYGFDQAELKAFIEKNRLSGIDRVVPIGSTTDFSLVWDGYDLIRTLSRTISIK